MKKLLLRILSLTLAGALLLPLTGCRSADTEDTAELSVVTTIFPIYDWVMNVLGEESDEADVTLLLDSGVDLHSFQPTADDIIRIASCDLFIYVGGESDEWVEAALQESPREGRIVLNLMEVLGDALKEEEFKEGMTGEENTDEAPGENATEETAEEGPEYDEHIWLSLQNAVTLVEAIRDALTQLDPELAEVYTDHAAAYTTELQALDEAYRQAVAEAPRDTVLFGDRFPFRYLTEDYGLDYYAAFLGCSAESEASFETVAFLADKVDELQLSAVLTLEGTDHQLAETIIASSGNPSVTILSLDSMQSTTSRDIQNGVTYLSVMEQNLAVLTEALQ